AYCPAAAIALKKFGASQMREQLQDLLPSFKTGTIFRPLIVSFCCLFEVTSRKFIKESSESYKKLGIHRIMVPCISRLSVPDILLPFELGVDGVIIIGCSDSSCLYPTTEKSLLGRIHTANNVLQEVGIKGKRIDYWKTEGSAEISWSSFWEISKRKLNNIINNANVKF
ncbi:MAG: hydrogenase iron-sulfur subunit, partial [Planctomycetota bacterium]